jgi:sarcosine oxidase
MKHFDAIVLGIGGMGSSALYHLAKRGHKALGIEQYPIAHGLGSSHGVTRLIRKAYFESEAYVPLLHRAYELWDEISSESKAALLHRVGLLIMGPAQGSLSMGGAAETARRHGVPIEILAAAEVRKRDPQFFIPDDHRALLEPGAGYLMVERCIEELCRLAQKHGATLHSEEAVQSWRADGDGVEVKTSRGTYRAGSLIITAGPWSARLVSDLGLPLQVRRVPQFWFPSTQAYSGPRTPCFVFDHPGDFIYGFPHLPGHGVKVARHAPGEAVSDPARINRGVTPEDLEPIAKRIEWGLPGVTPTPLRHSICMYTLTPDENFVVDRHPAHPQVAFAAGFSGHGFKFASVMGEILADFAERGETRHPIDFLRRRW